MKIRFLYILLLITVSLTAQLNVRSIETFSVEEGLSQTSVHTIFKDSRGLLWLGTEGGMNKFDGYEIIPFKAFDSRNIINSQGTIFTIIEDKKGNIWYGSQGLVSRLNIHSETSDNLEIILKEKTDLDFNVVMKLFEDSKGNIWFGTFGQGFFKVSADYSGIKNYRNDPDSTGDASLDYIRDFYEDSNGIIWIATYGGLVKFNPATDAIDNIFYREDFDGYKHTTIYKIIPFEKKLLLFTSSHGIMVYDPESEKVTEFDKEINSNLKNYPLRSAIVDKTGRIWICAYGSGIIVLDPVKKEVVNLIDFVDPVHRQSLIEPLSIHIDDVGILWVGTQHDGLQKLILGDQNIWLVNNTVPGYEAIENNVTISVAKDKYGKIWFASNAGLFKIDPLSKHVEELSISRLFNPSMLKIYNIIFTENNAWFSLGRYLIKYDLRHDNFDQYEIGGDSNIMEVCQLDSDTLLLGTTVGELYFYKITGGKLSKVTIQARESYPTTIIDCLVENETNLWVGTINGLFYVDLSQDSLYSQKIPIDLRLDFITSLTSRNDGKIWFTTYGDGLYSYNKKTKELEHFTHRDGFPDNTLYGIMVDEVGNLWMSSNRGVFEFNPVTKTVRTLDLSDGLQGYEFNSKAYSKSDDGYFFYGGINGFNYFAPLEIERNIIPPKLLIDKVILFDSVVVTNVGEDFDEVYEFSYYENSISFEFTALDFTNPSKNNYEYKLVDVDTSWIKAGNKRYATFPNINPGEYRFVVRGTNSDQLYNEKGASFSFIIHPPFWATWWFRSLLITAALLILYSVYKVRMMNQERRLREIETIRKRIADDFHDDLGHKLTRISLYSEMIRNQEEFGTNKQLYLDKISEASNSLFYETKDFIWSIDPGNDSLYDVLIYLKDFGDDFFNKSGIAFKVDEILEKYKELNLPMKWKREIILIFKEAMNNILKHSFARTAELKADVRDKVITITLSDDGTGFDMTKNQSNGRGLNSIQKRTNVVKGNLKIDSDTNGTVVKLTLKIEGV